MNFFRDSQCWSTSAQVQVLSQGFQEKESDFAPRANSHGRPAVQVRPVRTSFQPEELTRDPQEEAHRGQAVRLRSLQNGFHTAR